MSQGPTDHPGRAGLIPVPAREAHAYQSSRMVSGSPGTTRVPAPAPGGVPQDWSIRKYGSRQAGIPQWWLPGVYFERGPLEHAPVSVASDNQMPVPAIDPRGKPALMANAPKFLGQQPVNSRQALVRYASR